MRNLTLFVHRVVAGLLLLGLAQFAQGGDGRIVHLATLHWEPYVGGALPEDGFTAVIVREAFLRAGYRVRIHYMPWTEALQGVLDGKYDAVFPGYYSHKRRKEYVLSTPFERSPLGFYARKELKVKFRTLRDLRSYRIGVVHGYVNTEEFDAADYLEKIESETDAANLGRLVAGEVDLAVADRYTGGWILEHEHPDALAEMEFIDPPLQYKPLYVMFSRRMDHYSVVVDEFNREMRRIKAEGMIGRIRATHGIN